MTTQESEALIRRISDEVWNHGDVALLDELYAPDNLSQTVATFKRVVNELRAAFPDLRLTQDQIVAAGADVAVRWRITGTHQGHLRALSAADAVRGAGSGADHVTFLLDLTPTGRRVEFEGAGFFQIRDGRIVSAWVLVDLLSLLRQLGSLPIPNRMSP